MERDIGDVFRARESNWGKWGVDDEAGAVNYLTPSAVLSGMAAAETGEVFTLGLPINDDRGDPTWPGRTGAELFTTRDRGHFSAGKVDPAVWDGTAGLESAEDVLQVPTHATTHVDALGHTWYGDELYNGFDADTAIGGLAHCDVAPIARHGACGRGVLLDIATHRGVDALDEGERITLEELQACAEAQGTDLDRTDSLLLRTGWLERYYEDPEAFDTGEYNEPGITYSEPLVEWFDELAIPLLGTDTLANEQTLSEETGSVLPLHGVMLRDLGVLFCEGMQLDSLADACRADERYTFFFMCSPLKIVGGTASPVNPIAIR